ncbi:MAG: hypothetical protein QW320_07890 [Ignisphaera sp.]
MPINKRCGLRAKRYEAAAGNMLRLFLLLVLVILLGISLSAAVGQRVEPVTAWRLEGVILYSFNSYIRSFAAVRQDGTVVVISRQGDWTATVDPTSLKAIYAVAGGVLLQRENSLELLSFDGNRRQLYSCHSLRILKVYSDYVLVECGRLTLLLNTHTGETLGVELDARPLDTWRHVVLLDLRTFNLLVLWRGELVRTNLSLAADVAYSLEGDRGVYLILADGSVGLLVLEAGSLIRIATARLSPPVAAVNFLGREYVVFQDGVLVDETGRKSSLPFTVAYADVSDRMYAVTNDGDLFFWEQESGGWRGPITRFAGRVVAVFPVERAGSVLMMVVTEKSGVLEGFLVGFRDYKASAALKDSVVYALETSTVLVGAEKEGGLRGTIVLSKEKSAVLTVRFESAERQASVPLSIDTPGCFDVTVEIEAQGYYPSQSIPAGTLCVLARPIRCELQSLQSEVEEGVEVELRLRVLDGLSNEEITRNVLARISRLTILHLAPKGEEELVPFPPSELLKLRLRGEGEHRLSALLPQAGPYGNCSTNVATVKVKSTINVPLLALVLASLALGSIAAVLYSRAKATVWRSIEKAISSGTSCEQLISKLSGVLPAEKVSSACEFVNLNQRIADTVDRILSALQSFSDTPGIREVVALLREERERLNALRTIYLKEGPSDALSSLLDLQSTLGRELKRLVDALEHNRKELEKKREEYRSYLSKLELYKDRTSPKIYLRLKNEYERNLKSIDSSLSRIEDALQTILEFVKL